MRKKLSGELLSTLQRTTNKIRVTLAAELGFPPSATIKEVNAVNIKFYLAARQEHLSINTEIDSIIGTDFAQSWKYIFEKSDLLSQSVPFGKPTLKMTTVLFEILNEMKKLQIKTEKTFAGLVEPIILQFIQIFEMSLEIQLRSMCLYIDQHNEYRSIKLPATIEAFKNWHK